MLTAMAAEATLERYFRLAIRRAGGRCIKIVSDAGVPDRLVLLPGGQLHLVELKAPGETLRPIQRVFRAEAARCDVQVHVIDSAEACASFLANYTETEVPS